MLLDLKLNAPRSGELTIVLVRRAAAYSSVLVSPSDQWLCFGCDVLTSTVAYLLGSLVTFVPALAGLIGSQQDSKHMVATVTVWFHPARTIGSMHLATMLGILGFLYSGVIGFTSMGVSTAFAQQDLLIAGHVVVLLVFVGGGGH